MINNPSPQTNKWVQGYIVGYVNGRDFVSGAVFALPDKFADYNGTNLILSSVPPGQADITNSIPVNVTLMRQQLGLSEGYEGRDKFGKMIYLYGNIGEVLQYSGVDAVSKYKEE